MGCSQLHFDVNVANNHTIETEPQTIMLTKTSALHIVNGDPCSAPVQVCVNRVVQCQKGCATETFVHDFPIDPSDPILPPGTYQIYTMDGGFVSLDGGATTVDIIFEEVTPEYVQAVIANKSGAGCEN